MPRIADLFCGAGGAAMGLHRAGFEVVGFDIKPQKHYPFEFHQRDVMEMTPGDLQEFDAVWASPPCQFYVGFTKGLRQGYSKHWDSIPPTRSLLQSANAPYIIENVPGTPLANWTMLCGTMFKLKVIRHRWFETNWGFVFPPFTCTHEGCVTHGDYAAVCGHSSPGRRKGKDPWGKQLRDAKPDKDAPPWAEAMGIDWMTREELTQAIPPAYSEFLGKHLLGYLEEG